MDNGITSGNLLRLIGFMAIAVGAAWALQTLGLGAANSTASKLGWVMAAAAIAGAGTGLIVAASALQNGEAETVRA